MRNLRSNVGRGTMDTHVSTPSAARLPDATAPSESKARVCPTCRTRWKESDAPATCPNDGAAIVRADELPSTGDAVSTKTPASGTKGSDAPEVDPMVGRTLEGRYTILAKLGAGSMGTVYRARQHAMGRDVAIKILRGDRAGDESSKARFMREARANSLLASPNTVTVFDFGQSESGEFYLAMELLEGESLGQRLARVERLPVALAVDTARQALRSLGEAHAKGIVHRDLKPDNLFFARVVTGGARDAKPSSVPPPGNPHEEIVKVLDFGIAKLLNADQSHPMGVVETQAGTVFGTPRYMSPEQAQGKVLDARSDLYSLGVILYQMLTGKPPFTDDDAILVMARHIKSTPKPIRESCPEAAIPRELEDVVMRVLAKDPSVRPATAEALASELLAALEAQGATASGVRASITNAAGIRVPDSIRPPPASLAPSTKAKKKRALRGLVVVGLAVVTLGVAIGVYLGMSRHNDEGAGAAASATSTNPTHTDSPRAAAKVASSDSPIAKEAAKDADRASATESVTTTTPDALPTAAPIAPSTGQTTSTRRTNRGGRATSTQGAPASKTPNATPPASPSSSGSYGIFD